MSSAAPFSDAVSVSIASTLDRGHHDLADITNDALELHDVALSLTASGKRLRARLAYWGWRAALTNGDPTIDWANYQLPKSIVDLGVGLELFHAAALIHDDIIDNSDTRRGVSSAHRQFESLHGERGWESTSSVFGKSSAILLGDLLLAWADDAFLGTALSLNTDTASLFKNELRTMRTDVTTGQYLDNRDAAAWRSIPTELAIERAQRVVIFKSAKYSVEAPLVLGALVGGAPRALVSSLRAFALPLGFAFQLRDDILGIFGDTETTGKPAGDDLREGKRTVLLAVARERADRSTLEVLDELIGDPSLTDDQVSMLRATLIDLGAVAAVEDLITRSHERAITALNALGLDSSVDAELRDLTTALTHRSS